MNTNIIKKLFPFFKNNGTTTYLDSAATTHKPQVVLDALLDFYSFNYASIQRGLYPHAEHATELYESARADVASFINAATPEEIVFTSGATASINFIASSWALQNLTIGDEILVTTAEHHANLIPWQRVCQKTGASLRHIRINPNTLQVNLTDCVVSERTKLLAVTLDSNVLNNIWGVNKEYLTPLITKIKAQNGFVLLDAAQAVAHEALDVQKLNADFVAFSGHKLFGPTGVGVLYINRALHNSVEPYQVGGGMVHTVTEQNASWARAPHKFEAGTPPIAQVIGLHKAIDFISSTINYTDLAAHETALCSQLVKGLDAIKQITLVANREALAKKGHLVSFFVKNVHGHDLASYLGAYGIAIRAGNHCAQPLLTQLNTPALLRVSISSYNTTEDIDTLLKTLEQGIVKLTIEATHG